MLINNLQKGESDANRDGMGGGSWKVGRLKKWKVNVEIFELKAGVIYLHPFFDLKESLVHLWRIVQVISVGDAIEVLVDS